MMKCVGEIISITIFSTVSILSLAGSNEIKKIYILLAFLHVYNFRKPKTVLLEFSIALCIDQLKALLIHPIVNQLKK